MNIIGNSIWNMGTIIVNMEENLQSLVRKEIWLWLYTGEHIMQ
jgi:hypothetical protein